MQEDIRGFSLASLAEITAEGRFLKAGFAAIHNGRICFALTFAFISFTTPATHFDPRRCMEKDGESGRAPATVVPSLIENGRLGPFEPPSDLCRKLWCEKVQKEVCFRHQVVLVSEEIQMSICPSKRKKKHISIKASGALIQE